MSSAVAVRPEQFVCIGPELHQFDALGHHVIAVIDRAG